MKNLDSIIKIAKHAGDLILDIYNRQEGFIVEKKSDHSPITEADCVAHDHILKALCDLDPTIPILSEEAAEIDFSVRSQWGRYWLVDPLDGTKDFIRRTDDFTVNIALIDEGCSVLGVIVLPVFNETYFAAKGEGVFKQVGDGAVKPIHTRPCDPDYLHVAVSRMHHGPRLQAQLAKMGSHDLIQRGSSIKSCLVAEGAVDIYPRFGPTSEWDTAAAQCIVEEAGGAVLDLSLQPLRYNTKDSLINPSFIVVGDTGFNWRSILPDDIL